MSKKQKLGARKYQTYFDSLCDDVAVYMLLFLEIDNMFQIKCVTKSGTFSRCLGKAIMVFPKLEYSRLYSSEARNEAVFKHCRKPSMLSYYSRSGSAVKVISAALHTISNLETMSTYLRYVLDSGARLHRLKKLRLMIDGNEILFLATDVPSLTCLELSFGDDGSESAKSFMSSELQKLKLLESLRLFDIYEVADTWEPPPNLKHLTLDIKARQCNMTRLSGKFPLLESFDFSISSRVRDTMSTASFLRSLPPLKNIVLTHAISGESQMLYHSRDTLQIFSGGQWVADVQRRLSEPDVVFPQLAEIWCDNISMESSKVLARVAPNLTSLNVVRGFSGESIKYLHEHGINLKSLVCVTGNSEILAQLTDATVFPELTSLGIINNGAVLQNIRNVRRDCVVSSRRILPIPRLTPIHLEQCQ